MNNPRQTLYLVLYREATAGGRIYQHQARARTYSKAPPRTRTSFKLIIFAYMVIVEAVKKFRYVSLLRKKQA